MYRTYTITHICLVKLLGAFQQVTDVYGCCGIKPGQGQLSKHDVAKLSFFRE